MHQWLQDSLPAVTRIRVLTATIRMNTQYKIKSVGISIRSDSIVATRTQLVGNPAYCFSLVTQCCAAIVAENSFFHR